MKKNITIFLATAFLSFITFAETKLKEPLNMGQNRITNLKQGKGPRDAVNFVQFKNLEKTILSNVLKDIDFSVDQQYFKKYDPESLVYLDSSIAKNFNADNISFDEVLNFNNGSATNINTLFFKDGTSMDSATNETISGAFISRNGDTLGGSYLYNWNLSVLSNVGKIVVSNFITEIPINNFADSNFKAGYDAGYDAGGNNNSYIGLQAGKNSTGTYNIYLGRNAGYEGKGLVNSYLGYQAGLRTIGSYNTYLGKDSGQYSIGTNNLYLGRFSGQYKTNNYKVYFGNYTTIDVNTAKIVNVTAGTDLEDAVNVAQMIGTTNGLSGMDFPTITNIADNACVNKLDRDGDAAGSLTVTNLTTIESINDFNYSNFKAGFNAGDGSHTSNSVFLGSHAGSSAKGNYNSYLGRSAGLLAAGDYNSYVGYSAGQFANGDFNSYLGRSAGDSAKGNYNSYVGQSAGYFSISTNNLYLGKFAGEYQTNENKAYFGRFTTIDVNTAKIVNVTAGTDLMDAVNVAQMIGTTNTVDGRYVNVAGDIMTGNLVMDDSEFLITEPGLTNVIINQYGIECYDYLGNLNFEILPEAGISGVQIRLGDGGIDMNDNTIESLADGVSPKDAVNVSQLDNYNEPISRTWFVTSSGDDGNVGDTLAKPLATIAEANRRAGLTNAINGQTQNIQIYAGTYVLGQLTLSNGVAVAGIGNPVVMGGFTIETNLSHGVSIQNITFMDLSTLDNMITLGIGVNPKHEIIVKNCSFVGVMLTNFTSKAIIANSGTLELNNNKFKFNDADFRPMGSPYGSFISAENSANLYLKNNFFQMRDMNCTNGQLAIVGISSVGKYRNMNSLIKWRMVEGSDARLNFLTVLTNTSCGINADNYIKFSGADETRGQFSAYVSIQGTNDFANNTTRLSGMADTIAYTAIYPGTHMIVNGANDSCTRSQFKFGGGTIDYTGSPQDQVFQLDGLKWGIDGQVWSAMPEPATTLGHNGTNWINLCAGYGGGIFGNTVVWNSCGQSDGTVTYNLVDSNSKFTGISMTPEDIYREATYGVNAPHDLFPHNNCNRYMWRANDGITGKIHFNGLVDGETYIIKLSCNARDNTLDSQTNRFWTTTSTITNEPYYAPYNTNGLIVLTNVAVGTSMTLYGEPTQSDHEVYFNAILLVGPAGSGMLPTDGSGAMSGDIAMGNNKIVNMADGTVDTDGATVGQLVGATNECLQKSDQVYAPASRGYILLLDGSGTNYTIIEPAYVFAYMTAETSTTITNAGQYYYVQGSFSNLPIHGFDVIFDANGPAIQYTSSESGWFSVECKATLSGDSPSITAHLAIKHNDTIVTNSIMGEELKATGEAQMMSSLGSVYLETDDEIQLVYTADGAMDVLTTTHFITKISREY